MSTDPPRTLPMIGLIGVELTITSISFCGWCDTEIARHTPRVVRRYYVGEKTQDEFMHASCAFHFDDGSWLRHGGRVHSDCAGCAAHIDIDQPRAVSLFSHKPPKPRWTPAAGCRPLSFCFPCVRSFVERHGGLLDGYVSAQQMAAPVAWRHAKTHSPFNPAVGQCEGEPPLPKDAAGRERFLGLFRGIGSAENEEIAVERHEALRGRIAQQQRAGTRRQDHWEAAKKKQRKGST